MSSCLLLLLLFSRNNPKNLNMAPKTRARESKRPKKNPTKLTNAHLSPKAYCMDLIVAEKGRRKGQRHFLIKWTNYPTPTWITESALNSPGSKSSILTSLHHNHLHSFEQWRTQSTLTQMYNFIHTHHHLGPSHFHQTYLTHCHPIDNLVSSSDNSIYFLYNYYKFLSQTKIELNPKYSKVNENECYTLEDYHKLTQLSIEYLLA